MAKTAPAYSEAVEWIALNDNAGERDLEAVKASPAVALVAELYEESALAVARDVLRLRTVGE